MKTAGELIGSYMHSESITLLNDIKKSANPC